MANATIYYPVHVSSSGRTSLRWGPPCERPGEARRLVKEEIAGGTVSMGFVVRDADGERDVLHQYTEPVSARKVVMHLLALEEALDEPPA